MNPDHTYTYNEGSILHQTPLVTTASVGHFKADFVPVSSIQAVGKWYRWRGRKSSSILDMETEVTKLQGPRAQCDCWNIMPAAC
jgi:hypothetical protein